MTPEEARIAAHICGDGCLSMWTEKNALQIVHGRRYHRHRIRYEIVYSNNDQRLLKQFYKDLKRFFRVKPRIYKDEVRTKSKRVFEHIKKLGGGSTYEWKISDKILKSTRRIKLEWITAFFDDEGTVDLKQKRVRIRSMNYPGLRSAAKLFKKLDINPRITGPNADRSWWLTISGLDAIKFSKTIKSEHTKKKKQLSALRKRLKNE